MNKFCKESKDFKEAIFQEDRSLRSGPKLSSQKKTPVFVVSSGSQPVKSGCGVSGPIFDPDVFVSGASVNGQSTLPGFENVRLMNKFLEGSEEEPEVMGDTPPEPKLYFLQVQTCTLSRMPRGISILTRTDEPPNLEILALARKRVELWLRRVGASFSSRTRTLWFCWRCRRFLDVPLRWPFLDAHVLLFLLDLDVELCVLQSERRSLRLLSV